MLAGDSNDRRLHTDGTFAAVEDQRQAAVHIDEGVLRVGGAGLTGKVCGRGGKRHAAGLDDGLHHRVGRHAHAHGIQPRAGHIADFCAARHDHRQRAGPEGFGQFVGAGGHLGHDAFEHLHAVDVYDQGVILRAALGFKNLFYGFAVAGVGRDAIDGLGRQGNKLAFLQQFCRQCNALVIDWQNLCIHCASPLFALSFSSRSARISGSSTRSRSPSSTPCRLRSVKPMR